MTPELLSDYIDRLIGLLNDDEAERDEAIQPLLFDLQASLSADQIALLFEAVPVAERADLWRLLQEDVQREAFLWLLDGSRKALLRQLDDSESKQLLVSLSAEDLLELAEELPERFLTYAFEHLDSEQKQRYQLAAGYDVTELGHWLLFDCPRVSERLRVQSARNVLKKLDAPYIESVYLVDAEGHLQGEIGLRALYEADPMTPLVQLTVAQAEPFHATDDMDEAAARLMQSTRMSWPVVDAEGVLLGRFHIAAALEHKREIDDALTAKAGGLTGEEDLFSSVWRSSKNRALWLGINLLTAFLAAWFIGLFEATLQQVVALAVLMPVVASMGGISGSQTLTVLVRGLALGQVTDSNLRPLLLKEIKVGCVNGVLWALVIGLVTHQWFGSWMLGITIGVAILLNILAAVVAGVYVPAILDRFKFDPALSGAVVLTTVTDIVGFVVFLGLGTILLL